MKLTKKLTALGLSLALGLSPALAAGADEKFPAVNAYAGFSDVQDGTWYAAPVRTCYEVGLMNGTGGGAFSPFGTLTVSEVATVAARIREAVTGHPIGAQGTGAWYQRYVDYLKDEILEQHRYAYVLWLLDTPTAPADRYGALCILDAALEGGQDLLAPINSITDLPDCHEPVVLRFYNAGILTGVDKYGTFLAQRGLTRSEFAAMTARIVREELRMSFVPADYTPFAAASLAPTDLLAPGVTAEMYLPKVMERIAALERQYAAQGGEFNWQDPSGLTTASGIAIPHITAVKEGALTDCGGDPGQATELYKTVFDPQVFYARYISLTGELLGVEMPA